MRASSKIFIGTRTHINSATFKLTVILLKMTCITCRNVWNKNVDNLQSINSFNYVLFADMLFKTGCRNRF